MLCQPAFGGVTVFGQMKQFGGVGVLLKDAHGVGGWPFDDVKPEITVEGMSPPNRQHHHATTGKITLVEGDASGGCISWPITLWLLLDQARDAVAILPRGLLKRAGGFGMPSEYRTSEPSGALS